LALLLILNSVGGAAYGLRAAIIAFYTASLFFCNSMCIMFIHIITFIVTAKHNKRLSKSLFWHFRFSKSNGKNCDN